MSLLSLRDITLSFGGPPLLDKAQLTVHPRERICLIGRNGEGKSSLLRLINGEQKPDSGEFEHLPSLRITKLDQDFPESLEGTAFDIAIQGGGEAAQLLIEYHHITAEIGGDNDAAIYERMDQLQTQLDSCGGWELEQKIERILTKLNLDGDTPFNHLSGGMKRRVLLAKALACDPDILLLDEPTNHLDIESIRWLEHFLIKFDKSLVFITHDRMFLTRVATRIIELDRGQLTSWDCDYEKFLERKEAFLEAEKKNNAVFDKKLALEEAWIRQGIRARRTRNEGRVRALKQLRKERSERRERVGTVSLELQDAQLSGRKVITAKNISMTYEGKCLINNFSTRIARGDKIGIIGPNGSGKSTLIKILLEQIQPDSGTIEQGTKLEVAYYDQHRTQLDETKSVMDNVWDVSDTVYFNGRAKNIMAYMQDFLFDPETARGSIKYLSGGERNRLMLAKLFTQKSNVLVMDEPTNDLDVETMELLEDLLMGYPGTLLLVSHDRTFLNNSVTSTIALEGKGVVKEYVGGYDDWQRHQQPVETAPKPVKKEPVPPAPAQAAGTLSQKEKRELEALPAQLEALEAEQSELFHAMSEPDYYTKNNLTPEAAKMKVKAIEAKLADAYARWEALELRTEK